MSMTDPIADALTRIRNAAAARHETVDVPASKQIGRILEIFKQDGYIEDYRFLKNNVQGTYRIYLRYDGRQVAITGLKRVSKPGLRVYVDRHHIPKVLNGLGTAVLSTSKGIITDRDARELKVGGEVICTIW